jgi:hypothetical protein
MASCALPLGCSALAFDGVPRSFIFATFDVGPSLSYLQVIDLPPPVLNTLHYTLSMQSRPPEDQPRPVETFTVDDGATSLGFIEQGPVQMWPPYYCVPRSLTISVCTFIGESF